MACLRTALLRMPCGMQFTIAKPERMIQEIIDALNEYVIGVTNETYEYFDRENKTRARF